MYILIGICFIFISKLENMLSRILLKKDNYLFKTDNRIYFHE